MSETLVQLDGLLLELGVSCRGRVRSLTLPLADDIERVGIGAYAEGK